MLVVGLLFGAGLLFPSPCAAQLARPASLSPYWGWGILQWEELILRHAARGNLDPDFLAALVWRESGGNADEVSYAGAVGLMQVMPYELGFLVRPTGAELLDPDVNLSEGVRILRFALDMAHGDPFRALALYNGGSQFEHTNEARGYARGVIELYMMALAERSGYDYRDVEAFGLVFQVQGLPPGQNAATIFAPGRATIWQQVAPGEVVDAVGTVLYSTVDEYGVPWRVVTWLLPNAGIP